MERSVAVLRALVVGANVAVYSFFIYGTTPRTPMAVAICVFASFYALWSLGFRPYERYPLLRYGLATILTDAFLITLWVTSTGGPASEFWVVYIVSSVSAAMRYGMSGAVAVALFESALYVGVTEIDGGLGSSALMVRTSYIVLTALAAGMVARLEATARADREVYQRMAAEREEMLDRERVTVEKLRELDELKNTFISAVSHELRTPLTSVVGFAKTLQRRVEELKPGEVQMITETILANGEKLQRLLLDLLDLNTLNAGVATANLAPVPVESVVRRLAKEANTAGRPLVVRASYGLVANLDCGKFERIIDNLVINAIKYSPDRSPITVRATADGPDLILSVSDRGDGVPDEYKEIIFQQFRQGPSQVWHAPGTGIGLALVMQIAHLHGGRAWVEDRKGGGATFNVLFPGAVLERSEIARNTA